MSISLFHCLLIIIAFFFLTGSSTSSENDVFLEDQYIKVYKDGRFERKHNEETVFIPPSFNPQTGVTSKDLVISAKTDLLARLYLPNIENPNHHKLPLLVYFHGGGFLYESTTYPNYHNYLNLLISEANVVAVSVDYRLAPEHHVPIAYDDSWEAIKWVVSHSAGKGAEKWLNDYADFDKVFLAGDSAGGNIAHNMAIRAGKEGLGTGVKFVGMVLLNPFFWGSQPLPSELSQPSSKVYIEKVWQVACPTSSGFDDPRLNVVLDPKLPILPCRRVLVCVAGEDALRDRGIQYYEKLGISPWTGKVELMESQGVGHVFFLNKTTSQKARTDLMKKVVSFLNK